MQFFVATLLVTLPQMLHGSDQVQGKWYHTLRCSSLTLLKETNQADTSAWRGMALGVTAPSPVQLTYIVSNIFFNDEIAMYGMKGSRFCKVILGFPKSKMLIQLVERDIVD